MAGTPEVSAVLDALRAENEELRAALESRATIEQAKGIVMATMHCTPDEAFDLLRQQSQHENRKLRDIARDLVIGTSRTPISTERRHGDGVPAADGSSGSVPAERTFGS